MNVLLRFLEGMLSPENLPVVLILAWLVVRLEWTRRDTAKAHEGIGAQLGSLESQISDVRADLRSVQERLHDLALRVSPS